MLYKFYDCSMFILQCVTRKQKTKAKINETAKSFLILDEQKSFFEALDALFVKAIAYRFFFNKQTRVSDGACESVVFPCV